MNKVSWNRDEEGVIVLYVTDQKGRVAPVADIWAQPLIDKLGLTRPQARAMQEAVAEMVSGAVVAAPAPDAVPELPEWIRDLGTGYYNVSLPSGDVFVTEIDEPADLDRIADACRILAARRRADKIPPLA
jgi:hypothetical protein